MLQKSATVPNKKPKQRTGRRYSKNQLIAFGEMVAHEQINETNVAAYFTSIYEEYRQNDLRKEGKF